MLNFVISNFNIIHKNIKKLNLDKYIDYELQFEKAFLEPLKIILDSIGWNIEKTTSLENFFT
jgi:hypothetical protein